MALVCVVGWVPNDPEIVNSAADDGDPGPNQDNLYVTHATDAWTYSLGGVLVAVLDSGCNATHPELVGKIWSQYDFVGEDPIAEDTLGHGTAVTGVLAANTNNAYGMAGAAPQARVLCGKVDSVNVVGTPEDLKQGIRWAHDSGARAINMSIVEQPYDQELADLIAEVSQDTVLVAAAGNYQGYQESVYPAAYPGVLAVAGTTEGGLFAWPGSNWGPYVDISAPAVKVWALSYAGGCCNDNGAGTSLASPQVAAAAAVDFAKDPKKSAEQVRADLLSSAQDRENTGYDEHFGWGLVDFKAAMSS